MICHSTTELSIVAEAILEKYPQERIFALVGQMGAGKTTFMQAMAKQLGSPSQTSSPTFAIVNQYELPNNREIYHFDFYRIKNIDEAFNIGFEDYLFSGNYCFIEWAEKVDALLPKETIKISIEVDPSTQNRIFSF